MELFFVAVLFRVEDGSGYTVIIPDLEGGTNEPSENAFSSDTLIEAIEEAEMYMADMERDELPKPTTTIDKAYKENKDNPLFAGVIHLPVLEENFADNDDDDYNKDDYDGDDDDDDEED
jgi:hypothetical protein